MKIVQFLLFAAIITLLVSPVEVYSQDSDLPESWVNPPPDPDDIITYSFEPSPLKPMVSVGQDGKLLYKDYSGKGDRILDWSKAGYMQSNVPIPDVPVRDTLSPLPGETIIVGNMAYPAGPDNREEIQAALYKIWQMPSDANGIKGALLLKAGTYYINGSLYIPPGVVLRGEGDDENGTVLICRSSNGGGNAIQMGQGTIDKLWSTTVRITDSYVPSGSCELSVTDASKFQAGDYIYVRKTVNQQWIDDLGMGERLRHIRGGEEGAGKKPWKPESYQFMHLRKIVKVEGNKITLDVMMPQSIAVEHGGGEVLKADISALSAQCGVESLRVVSNYDTSMEDTGKDANFFNFGSAVQIKNARDCWVRNVSAEHFYFAAVNVGDGTLQVTIRDCNSLKPVGPKRGGFRYSFNIGGGTGHLVYNCYTEDGRHDFVGGSRTMGPYAFVKCTAVRGGQSEPHHRWGTGFLFDNIINKDGSIAAINRGDSGSGHGWAADNTMIWNCDAPNIVVFDPETDGENNFAIGYTGDKNNGFDTGGLWYANTRAGYWGLPEEGKFYGFALMGSGYIESPNEPVEPRSLFIQQLIDRIGLDQAMRVLDDEQEIKSRIDMIGLFSVYPGLEKLNDSTFIIKFNMPVNVFQAIPENISILGNTGHEGTNYSINVLKDSTIRLGFKGIGPLPMFSELIVDVHNISSRSGEPLEGLTTASYVEPDQRPVVSGDAGKVNNEDGILEASSTKEGAIYLVKYNEDATSLDPYSSIDELDQAVSNNLGRKVNAPVASTPVEISTAGLPGGYYIYYAVDEDGRMSEPGNEWPQVEETAVSTGLGSKTKNSAYSVWSSNEIIFIQPDDISVKYSVSIFDMTGRLIAARKDMQGKQKLVVPTNTSILIIRLVSENGYGIGAHKLFYNP